MDKVIQVIDCSYTALKEVKYFWKLILNFKLYCFVMQFGLPFHLPGEDQNLWEICNLSNQRWFHTVLKQKLSKILRLLSHCLALNKKL